MSNSIEKDVLGILTTESLFLNQAPSADILGQSRIELHELVNNTCKNIADILLSPIVKTPDIIVDSNNVAQIGTPPAIDIDPTGVMDPHTKETVMKLIPHFKALKNVIQICQHQDLSWIRGYALTFLNRIWDQIEANQPALVVISDLCSVRYWMNALIVQHYYILSQDS